MTSPRRPGDARAAELSARGAGDPPRSASAPAREGATADERDAVARIWAALREVEDPELPLSLVDMGLIVSVAYDPPTSTAALEITYTAMGCPAMEMIQEDIRARLLREPGVLSVRIEVVWDPVWTSARLSAAARARLRALGTSV